MSAFLHTIAARGAGARPHSDAAIKPTTPHAFSDTFIPTLPRARPNSLPIANDEINIAPSVTETDTPRVTESLTPHSDSSITPERESIEPSVRAEILSPIRLEPELVLFPPPSTMSPEKRAERASLAQSVEQVSAPGQARTIQVVSSVENETSMVTFTSAPSNETKTERVRTLESASDQIRSKAIKPESSVPNVNLHLIPNVPFEPSESRMPPTREPFSAPVQTENIRVSIGRIEVRVESEPTPTVASNPLLPASDPFASLALARRGFGRASF